MQEKAKWMELCERAANEQDPAETAGVDRGDLRTSCGQRATPERQDTQLPKLRQKRVTHLHKNAVDSVKSMGFSSRGRHGAAIFQTL